MAIIRSALAPRIRKKVGDTIFKRRLGQTIASQRPLTVKNPKSPKQVTQRAKFKIMVQMVAICKYFLLTVFPLATYRGTKFNKMSKFLLKKIGNVAYPLTDLTYLNFNATACGNGAGFNVIPTAVTAHAGKSITVTWNPLIFPAGAPVTGTMSIMLINLTRKQVCFEQSAVAFTAGSQTFFSISSPLTVGDSVFCALGQVYTDAGGVVRQSQMTFQTVVAPVTILI